MGTYIIADNQELTRFAVESILRRDEDNTIRRAAGQLELFTQLQGNDDAVVVLDYGRFDFASPEQLIGIAEHFPLASWVLLCDQLQPRLISRVLHASHAFSVVQKDCPIAEIKRALEKAALGSRYICQQAMELLLSRREEEEVKCPLTGTEKEIAQGIARGLTTREIATQRFLSIHTVTTHRKNIFRKLNVHSINGIYRYAARMGWEA